MSIFLFRVYRLIDRFFTGPHLLKDNVRDRVFQDVPLLILQFLNTAKE